MLARRPLSAVTRASARPLFAQRASQVLFAGYRQLSTESTTADQALEILKKQRANRPVSPHLQIYQPQLTWYLSGLHRVTGVALAGSLYAFLLGYLALPLVGLPFDGAAVVSAFGALPLALKLALKFVASIPFTFHIANGFRHLIWDTASQLTIPAVYRTGYAVLGFTAIGSLFLTFL